MPWERPLAPRFKYKKQEHLRLKKYPASLPAAIEALGSPLGPHPKSDLATDLYSESTPIAIMDESDRQIMFNNFKESATSLLAVIEALGSPLGPHLESDFVTDLNSGSTPIAIMEKSDHRISLNCLDKSVISLSAAIEALDSPLGPYTETNLVTDLYSISIPIAIMDESDRWISLNYLNKYVMSLSTAIGALCSHLGPFPERDITTYLYSDSTPIVIKTSPIIRSVSDDFKRVITLLQKVTNE
jgi:hypothetical protein